MVGYALLACWFLLVGLLASMFVVVELGLPTLGLSAAGIFVFVFRALIVVGPIGLVLSTRWGPFQVAARVGRGWKSQLVNLDDLRSALLWWLRAAPEGLTVSEGALLLFDNGLHILSPSSEWHEAIFPSWPPALRLEDDQKTARAVGRMLERLGREGVVRFDQAEPPMERRYVLAHRGPLKSMTALTPPYAKLPEADQLGLPTAVFDLARLPRGLVLVTGSDEQARHVTLAAMVHIVNGERAVRIVTVADRIEYAFPIERSQIRQSMAVGDKEFGDAVEEALLERPDVMMVSRWRDMRTVLAALKAAEAGCLVLAGYDALDVGVAMDRFWRSPGRHAYSLDERTRLNSVLKGVVLPHPVPGVEGQTMFPAEVAILNPSTEMLSAREQFFQHHWDALGWQSLELALANLVRIGRITYPTAEEHCRDKTELARRLVERLALAQTDEVTRLRLLRAIRDA